MTQPDLELTESVQDEQSVDHGLAGLQLVGWGLLCTLVWVLVTAVTLAVVSEVDGASEATSEAGLLIVVFGQLIAGMLGWFILPRLILRRRRGSNAISWRRPTPNDVAWAVGAVLTIVVVLTVYGLIVQAIGVEALEPESTISDPRLFEHTSVIVALGFLVIICAPIYEEAFARGFVLGGLRPHWGAIPAVAISASIFSALHADLGSLIPFAVAGVALGIVYMRTGSLTAASMAHMGFNVIGFSTTVAQQLG